MLEDSGSTRPLLWEKVGPGIIILLSNLLLWRIWRGATSLAKIDWAQRRINDYLGWVIMGLGGAVIPIRFALLALFGAMECTCLPGH